MEFAEWLALREPADAAARAEDLVARVRRHLDGTPRLTVHDLGTGTGSMGRWLAPLLPWTEALDQPGAAQMRHARALLESRPYLTRVPDDTAVYCADMLSTGFMGAENGNIPIGMPPEGSSSVSPVAARNRKAGLWPALM